MNFVETRTEMNSPRFANDADRWAAVMHRDASADGAFYYSVRTTGVYCRPSCAAPGSHDGRMSASTRHAKTPSVPVFGLANVPAR